MEGNMSLSKHLLSILIVTLSLSASTAYADLVLQENAAGFCRVDGTVDNNHPGYTGTGFANTDLGYGKGITWRVSSETGGLRRFEFRYAYALWGRDDLLSINGAAV